MNCLSRSNLLVPLAFTAGAALTNCYYRPQSLFVSLATSFLGGTAMAFVARTAISTFKTSKIGKIYQKNAFKKTLQASTSNSWNISRKDVNWVGKSLTQNVRDSFQNFLRHVIIESFSNHNDQIDFFITDEALEKDVEGIIESYKKDNEGLCYMVTTLFGRKINGMLKGRPKAEELMQNFINENGREGALFFQYLYLLRSLGSCVKDFTKHLPSDSVLRALIYGMNKDQYDHLEGVIFLEAGKKIEHFTKFLIQEDKNDHIKNGYELNKFLSKYVQNPFQMHIEFTDKRNSIGHALYFYLNREKNYFLFFDSNDLCHTSANEKQFCEIIFQYLQIEYKNWKIIGTIEDKSL